MIDLLNKLLSRFNLQVVPKQEQSNEEYSLVEKTVKFLNTIPKSDLKGDYLLPPYVGDINYVQYKNGKTYFKDNNTQKYFCDYDMKKPSQEVLGHMIAETTFTTEELEEKLNND